MNPPQTNAAAIHLISVGPFGFAVARYLKVFAPNTRERPISKNEMPSANACLEASVNVIAAWRPVPVLCEFVDRISHQGQRPFLPLILEGTLLRLGPTVVPGRGGCWSCWVRRSSQHAPWPKETLMIQQFYAEHPDVGPKGYLEPFAMLAAVRIRQTIAALDSSAIPGCVWQIDTLTRHVTTSVMTGIHDCPRCGLHRSARELSFAEMQRSLRYLWSDDSGIHDDGKA